ncbi:MAG: TonB-dependent receptor [Rikenellaceae bacterium]|nr:TonB-dependent receptor [Rikenellaceae bacterium]
MKRFLCLPLLLFFVLPSHGQTSRMLTGRLVDEPSGEPVSGATVWVKENPQGGTVTDEFGKFSLPVCGADRTLLCSCLGYRTLEYPLGVEFSGSLILYMTPDSRSIEQIVVSSRSSMERVSSVQIGVERIEIAEMAKIPALFGEKDIMRSIQLLPGVKSEGEGSSGFQVRGGTSAQNLILLDDATVYNASHLMGIFSTFNDTALTNASLFKGQIPAQFGGATSSVFDISTKTGDMGSYHVDGSVGLLSAKLHVEGPLVADKASFFVAGRRTYLDLFLKVTDDFRRNTLNFYDLNAKVDYNISGRDRLFISFFSGRDNMSLEKMMEMKWGNTTATVRWFHRFSGRLSSNTSVILSSFGSDNSADILDTSNSFDSFIRHSALKESFTWTPGGGHEMKFGFQTSYLGLKSAEWNLNNYSEKEKRNAWENTLWLNEQWKISDRFAVSAGLRLNSFSALGGAPYYEIDESGDITRTLEYGSGKIVRTHFALEPRLSVNYRVREKHSIKAGYSRTSQNIHALRNSSMALPFDRYTLSTNIVKPQTADQVSLGYASLTRNEAFEFSIEGYYKSIDNVLDYKDGKSFSSEIEIERLILAGQGRAYGVELFARKNTGRFTGWAAYTLSWSQNRIPGINGDKWYTAGNDRRHDLSLVGMFELPRGWQVAGTWVYNTGQALSAPSAKYRINGETVYYYAERNGYRAPSYHRFDISATHSKKKKRFTREWTLGIYNLYNRYNPFLISFEDDSTKPSGTKTVQTSLFGIIPSFSYNFRF